MASDAIAIRDMSTDEIREEISRAQEELARLRYRTAFEELENPSLLRTLRREIARLKTIDNERSAESSEGSDAGEEN